MSPARARRQALVVGAPLASTVNRMANSFDDVTDLSHLSVSRLVDALVDDIDHARPLTERVVWELARRAAAAEGEPVWSPA